VNLRAVYAGILSIVCGAAAREARAQTDSIGRIFRDVLVEVAEAGELPRLDSTALLGGVHREIRIYDIGVGQPYRVVRLIQHTHGVDGQFGVFWPVARPRDTRSSPYERRLSREERAFDATVRAWADTAYDCRAIKQSRLMNVCWLAPQPGRVVWAQLLARLDSLGVDSVPSPARPKIVIDGWISLVEVRTPLGYRSYFYCVSDSTSANAGERASARIETAVWEAFRRRVGR
jgi:hypothetical protein